MTPNPYTSVVVSFWCALALYILVFLAIFTEVATAWAGGGHARAHREEAEGPSLS